MLGTNFGTKPPENKILFNEDTLIDNLEAAPLNMFIETYTKCILPNQKSKSLEGVDSYGKKVSDVYDECVRAIQHTLVALASEVDHGNSLVSEARADLDMYHADKTNSYLSHTFPTPFMSRFINNIEKRKNNLSEAISEYENKIQEGKQAENSTLLLQVLQEQNEAIVRCSSRISEIQRKADELRSLLEKRASAMHRQSIIKFVTEDDSKKSIVSAVQTSYVQFLEERKHNIEKRDTTTNYKTLCEVPKSSNSKNRVGSASLIFGKNKTAGT